MKEQEIKVAQKKWHKGNLPFAGGRQKFLAVPKKDRSQHITKMLQVKQIPSNPPVVYAKDFTSNGKFKYLQYNLHYHAFEQTDTPRAIYVHAHGLNSHGQSSGYFASVIAQRNLLVNVYSFDQMNFGQSQGPYRGQISSLEDSIEQLQAFVEFILQKYKNKPKVFIGGSSYGGSIVFKASIKKPQKYDGVVLLAPALRNLQQKQAFLKKVGKFLGLICPRARLFKGSTQDSTKYNQDERVNNDPYYYNEGLVPGSVRTVLNAMDQVSEMFQQFSLPYILFQAGVDKMVDPFAPLDLEENCQSKDKTTVYCEEMWHSVFAEEQIEGIAWHTAQWLSERI